MKIWHLDFEVDEYNNLIVQDEEDLESLEFNGNSKSNIWQPMNVKIYGRKPLSDVTCLSLIPGIPVFNKKALEVLDAFINDSVEILSLNCNKGEFFAINVINILDCIDYDKSEYISFKSSGRIMRFEKYVFIKESVKEKHIFKIIDEPRRRAFVSDEFRNKVLESSLTGFKFELAWDSEEM